ncbi:MAG TPA: DUF3999 family protein [Candidatus Udaeobacter sp.]|nr:DUF3999 family protein [Candidatus Udaeobacter sp.]
MKRTLPSHPLRNFRVIVGVTTLVAAQTCLAFDPHEWRNTQALEVPAKGLVRVNVPAATLDAAQPGLEDLRIVDSIGNQIPYLIERLLPGPESKIRPEEFRSTIENSATHLILKTGTSAPIIGVSFETPATHFMKAADVEGSNDGRTWIKLAGGDSVFHLGNGATKLRVSFPEVAWQLLRITIDDLGSPPIPFSGAHLHKARTTAPAEAVAVTIKSRDESPGTTRLALDLGAANLTLGSLRIESNEPVFTRAVTLAVPEVGDDGIGERNIADAVIYRVNVNGKNEAHLEVPLESEIHTRELLVLVRNEDSPPLSIDNVRADRRLVRLTFFANQPGQYSLLSGNSQCAPPRYDLSVLSGKLRNATATDVVPLALAPNPNYKPPEALAAVTLTGAQIDVAKWKFRKLLALTPSSVQQVELDPELLARSQPDQRDIRIVHGEYQLPFLFERTSLSRPIGLNAAAANDQKKPALSCWSLKIPQPGVPITRLVCTSSSPLFHRQMRLWEEVLDERGDKFASELGRATWDQTPNSPKRDLVIELNARPQSDRLFLETDNGDNPAIELRDFRSYYQVTRVVFKATPDPAQPVWLFYGNLDATAPRYDLALVAGELLRAERGTVAAGPEQNLSSKPSFVGQTLTGSTRYIFWGALALVVIVLLAIMSRFLPKPQQQ